MRERLARLDNYLAPDQDVGGETVAETRILMRQVFELHADRPMAVARGIESIVDEILLGTYHGAAPIDVQIPARMVKNTVETITFLSGEGFAEGAWFRASDAIVETKLLLELIEALSGVAQA